MCTSTNQEFRVRLNFHPVCNTEADFARLKCHSGLFALDDPVFEILENMHVIENEHGQYELNTPQ